MVLPISHIEAGDRGRVVWIASGARTRQRLDRLGILPEEMVVCVVHTPRKKIIGCLVRGRIIFLRRRTANEIFIELIP